MTIILTIFLVIASYFIYKFWGYKRLEKEYKKEVYTYINNGANLESAIKKAFNNLNKEKSLGLDKNTLETVANELAALRSRTDVDNIIDLYSSFVYEFILDAGSNPSNTTDEKVLFAIENLEFRERGGYLVIHRNATEKFHKHFSSNS